MKTTIKTMLCNSHLYMILFMIKKGILWSYLTVLTYKQAYLYVVSFPALSVNWWTTASLCALHKRIYAIDYTWRIIYSMRLYTVLSIFGQHCTTSSYLHKIYVQEVTIWAICFHSCPSQYWRKEGTEHSPCPQEYEGILRNFHYIKVINGCYVNIP